MYRHRLRETEIPYLTVLDRNGIMLGKETGGDISRCGKSAVRLYPTKCCHWDQASSLRQHSRNLPHPCLFHSFHVNSIFSNFFLNADRQLRFQLNSGREHPPRDKKLDTVMVKSICYFVDTLFDVGVQE
eukprot:gene27291-biopygen8176